MWVLDQNTDSQSENMSYFHPETIQALNQNNGIAEDSGPSRSDVRFMMSVVT